MKLLVDENLSPQIAVFLKNLGHDVVTVRDLFKGAEDSEIVEKAMQEGRAILTQDKDFGHIYYFSRRKELKVVVARPQKQTVGSLKNILEQHLEKVEEQNYGLFVLTETGYREFS